VWLMDLVDITLGICLSFADYALQLARLTLRARHGRLLAASMSLFGGYFKARQVLKKSSHDGSCKL
jgi:hypothetical protein